MLLSFLAEAGANGSDGTNDVTGAYNAVAITGSSITVPSRNTSRVSARVYPWLIGATLSDSWVVSL